MHLLHWKDMSYALSWFCIYIFECDHWGIPKIDVLVLSAYWLQYVRNVMIIDVFLVFHRLLSLAFTNFLTEVRGRFSRIPNRVVFASEIVLTRFVRL